MRSWKMNITNDHIRLKIIKIYTVLLGVGILYYVWTKLTGIYIPCFYLSMTGALCPGCGITKMFISMIEGEFVKAFFYNPVAYILFFVWNLIALLCFWGKVKIIRNSRFLYTMLGITMALLVCFGIVRNLQ